MATGWANAIAFAIASAITIIIAVDDDVLVVYVCVFVATMLTFA